MTRHLRKCHRQLSDYDRAIVHYASNPALRERMERLRDSKEREIKLEIQLNNHLKNIH